MPTNQIERLLLRAKDSTDVQKEFYRELLDSNLIVMSGNNEFGQGKRMLQESATVNIAKLSNGAIPIFSSRERIFDGKHINEDVQILEIKGRDLFELAQGATFILNPYSKQLKELVPEEMAALLDGRIFSDGAGTITIEKETEIRIGQPAVYPFNLVTALKVLFAQEEAVNAAYLAWIHNPSSGEPPHYLFGIDYEGEQHEIIDKAGMLSKKFLKTHEIVDFIRITKSGGVDEYLLNKTNPFYQK